MTPAALGYWGVGPENHAVGGRRRGRRKKSSMQVPAEAWGRMPNLRWRVGSSTQRVVWVPRWLRCPPRTRGLAMAGLTWITTAVVGKLAGSACRPQVVEGWYGPALPQAAGAEPA